MNRNLRSPRVIAALAIAYVLATPGDRVTAQTPTTVSQPATSPSIAREIVAGRGVDETAAHLSDENRTARLRAVRSLVAFGAPAGTELVEAVKHEDAAVRYIAAVGLGQIGGESLQDCQPSLRELMRSDPSLAVRMAAAFAICSEGGDDDALALLVERVQSPSRGCACSAAELLGMLGPEANSAIDILTNIAAKNRPGGRGDYHIGGAAQKALRQIQAEAR